MSYLGWCGGCWGDTRWCGCSEDEFDYLHFAGDPGKLVGGTTSLNDVDGEFLDSGSDLRFDFFKLRIVSIMHYFVDREARQEDLVVASIIVVGGLRR